LLTREKCQRGQGDSIGRHCKLISLKLRNCDLVAPAHPDGRLGDLQSGHKRYQAAVCALGEGPDLIRTVSQEAGEGKQGHSFIMMD
jgi:hypothetical protein